MEKLIKQSLLGLTKSNLSELVTNVVLDTPINISTVFTSGLCKQINIMSVITSEE